MDESTENQVSETPMQEETQPAENPSVSFPTIPSSQKQGSNIGKVILIISILAIVGVLGFFIFKGSQSATTATPTPGTEGIATEVPTATPTPADKSTIQIEVQNGTGIAGEAAYLQGVLKSLGYSNITVGNSSSQDNTATTVTFNTNTAQSVVDGITAKLQATYQSVQTKTSSSQTQDVLIVTGLRKGATPKPVETPAQTATPTESPTPTPSR